MSCCGTHGPHDGPSAPLASMLGPGGILMPGAMGGWKVRSRSAHATVLGIRGLRK